MIAIGIVTHNDLIDRTQIEDQSDAYEVLKDLITTIDLFTKEDYVLIIRDNDSFDFRFKKLNVLLKNTFGRINSVFIHSDVNDLTHAWNEILTLALEEFDCEGAAILNQDILVTKDWNNFIRAIKIQSRDMLAPMSSSAVFQILQQKTEDKYTPVDVMTQVPCVQGFCYGVSRRGLIENKFDSSNKITNTLSDCFLNKRNLSVHSF